MRLEKDKAMWELGEKRRKGRGESRLKRRRVS